MDAVIHNRTRFSLWAQAVRPFAYSASITPVLIGAMTALAYNPSQANWWLFPIILVGSVLIHTGTNLVGEYYDFKKGVDRPDTYGSSRILVDNLMEPQTVLRGGYLTFAAAFILGIVLVYFRGAPILIIGLIGIFGGYLYSGAPVGYKYVALGDLMVFIMMGVLMVLGSYYTLTGEFSMNVVYISFPIGFLVAAILHANNTRDIKHDSESKIKTTAILFGLSGAKYEYYFLVFGAYIAVIFMVLTGILQFWTLIVFLSLPPAIKNIQEMSKANVEKPELIMMLDVKTAQHHMLFGLLMCVGLILTALIKF